MMSEMSDRQLALAALGDSPEAASVASRLSAQLRGVDVKARRELRLSTTSRFPSWVRPAMVAMAVALAANLVVVRLVPTYAQAVVHAPFVSDLPRPVLQLAGLTEAQVSRVTVSSTSSGHTLTLLGASADSARTVLLVQVDGQDSIPSKTAAGYYVDGTLTDQYGKSYQQIGGQGGDLWFAPLSGQASHGAAQLTLHVQSIEMWPASTPGTTARPLTSKERRVSGEWIVGTTVTVRPGMPVTLPAPQTIGTATYTVTSIRISGTQVTIDWKLTGDLRTVTLYRAIQNHTWPPAGDPRIVGLDNFLQASILKPDGSDAFVDGNSDSYGYGLPSDHLAEGTIQRVLPVSGNYVLRIGRPRGVDFGFTVP